jgi:hypothetical protein
MHLLDDLENAFHERFLDMLGDSFKAGLVSPMPVPNACTVRKRAVIEPERDDQVLIVLIPKVIGPDGFRRPALGLPRLAKPS